MIDIHVLYTAGCASTPDAVQRIQDVARDLGIPIEVTKTLVTTQSQAEQLRFLGSPTVQIEGLDMDPSARPVTEFGFT